MTVDGSQFTRPRTVYFMLQKLTNYYYYYYNSSPDSPVAGLFNIIITFISQLCTVLSSMQYKATQASMSFNASHCTRDTKFSTSPGINDPAKVISDQNSTPAAIM